jgi:hypothetical protein
MDDIELMLRSLPSTLPVEPLGPDELARRVSHLRRGRRRRSTIGIVVVIAVLMLGALVVSRTDDSANLRTVGPAPGPAGCAPQDTTSTSPSQFVRIDTAEAKRAVAAVRNQFDAALIHVDESVSVLALCDDLSISVSSTPSAMRVDQFGADDPGESTIPGLPDGTVGSVSQGPGAVEARVLRGGDPGILVSVRLQHINSSDLQDPPASRAVAIATEIASAP